MTLQINFLMLLLLTLISTSCSWTTCDREFKDRALKITDLYDSTNIDTFKIWNYIRRGDADVWLKNNGSNVSYRCVLINHIDSLELRIIGHKKFFQDFSFKTPIDTTYREIKLYRKVNGLIKIVAEDHKGNYITLSNYIVADSIFKNINPFDKFTNLNKLKDSLQIRRIIYNSRLGLIYFDLSAYHVLTYITDLDSLDNDWWIKEFKKGTMIKKHWNLRKLDEPLDY